MLIIIKFYSILGDSGYPAKSYLFTPLLNTETRAQQLYNESHIRTRTIVEHTFGIWKRRFPVAYGSRLRITTVMTIIIATAVPHNIAQSRGEDIPPMDEEELRILENIIADDHVNVNRVQNEAAGNAGLLARNILINEYFNNL